MGAEATRDSRVLRRNGREFSVTTLEDRWYGQSFWDAYEADDWEPHTIDLFESYIDQTTTFLDVGAAIGATALYAATIAKRVVALEPNRDVFEVLRANTELNPQLGVELANLALAGADGSMEFAPGGSLFSDIVFTHASTDYQVECLSIDTLLTRWNIHDRADELFLKIDIEGGEYQLIDSPGFREMIRTRKPNVLLAVHPGLVKRRTRFSRSRIRMMRKLNTLHSLFYERRVVVALARQYRYAYVDGTEIRALGLIRPNRILRGFEVMLSDRKLPNRTR